MKSNDATRASTEAMPEVNRRRFLTGAAGAATAAAVAIPAAATELGMTPVEKLRWHVLELAKLLRDDGAGTPLVILSGSPREGGYLRHKSIAFMVDEGDVRNYAGMFGGKAVL